MTSKLHDLAIAQIATRYREKGYEVEIEPIGGALPPFLQGFRPDLIAKRPGDNVVVEVKVGTQTSVAERLREVAERVSKEPGWRFSVVFADPDRADPIVDGTTTPLALLERRVNDAHQLIAAGQNEGAFLLLWSALEGVLRLLSERAQLPLTSLPPSMLIRELYSAGELGRDHFEGLMQLLPIRNQLAHGLNSHDRIEAASLEAIVMSLIADLRDIA
jgi:hypothetical protein